MRLVTLGVGAADSPRYRPAGLLVSFGNTRVIIDGGPHAVPKGRLDAWLLTDDHAELAAAIRRTARTRGLTAKVASFRAKGLRIEPRPVVHTNHPTFGYELRTGGLKVAWAPEFFEFPGWAKHADLMFAEASSWNRPIYFRGAVGGHLDALSVERAARRAGVKRLVFAHIGRAAIRAMERGARPSFGECAQDGQIFQQRVRPRSRPGARRPARASGAR